MEVVGGFAAAITTASATITTTTTTTIKGENNYVKGYVAKANSLTQRE